MKNSKFALAALAATVAFAAPAFAHHPLGGETPQTLLHGLLSGIGHPMIGFDHLAFVLLVGVIAAVSKARFMAPLAFVGGTVAGALLTVSGVTLPLVEWVIMASIIVLGGILIAGRSLPIIPLALLVGAAGLFHGWAYGEAIVGAEPTPILSYLFGFGVTQYVMALLAGFAATYAISVAQSLQLRSRLAGALGAGVGVTFLVEAAEAMIFAVPA